MNSHRTYLTVISPDDPHLTSTCSTFRRVLKGFRHGVRRWITTRHVLCSGSHFCIVSIPSLFKSQIKSRGWSWMSTHPSAAPRAVENHSREKLPTSNSRLCNDEKNGSAANNKRREHQTPHETFEFQETVSSTPQRPLLKLKWKKETRQVVKFTQKPLGSLPTIDSKNQAAPFPSLLPPCGRQHINSKSTGNSSGRESKKRAS